MGVLLLRPGVGLAQGMPFHMPTALPLPLAEASVRAFYQHVEISSLVRDGREIRNLDGRRVAVDAISLMAPYGLTPRTVLMLGVPYMRKTVERSGSRETNGGLGDALVIVKQELLQRDFAVGNRRLALFAGLTLPTGETENDDGRLSPPLRLGLGAVNMSGQLVYSYVDDRFGVHGGVGYSAAIGDLDGVRTGDRFRYDLALGYRLFPSVYQTLRDVTLAAYLEFNGTIERASRRDRAALSDTGGHTLKVAPGLQLIPLPNWALEASFQIPVVRELSGTQLGPDWSFAIGVRTLFYPFGP